jgi:hypothetical protein
MSEVPEETPEPAPEPAPEETPEPGVEETHAPTPRERLQQWLPILAPWLVLAVAALAWWSSFASTSAARIAALMPIEPYAFAVQEQLLHNFNETGSFFQSIHKGYDDDWTWSGHRAVTLVINGYLYGLDPDSFGLARLQGFWMLLGAIPAALIGRRVLRNRWGVAVGGLIYLGSPPVMALAMQDYQDLVFATPALVFAFWAMGAKHPLWAIAGAMVAVMPREECVPMAVIVAMLAIPWAHREQFESWKQRVEWKRWAWNMGITVLLAGSYAWWAEANYPLSDGHDMPLENAVAGLGGDQLFLDGWPYWDRFYAMIFVPLGILALFSPLTLLAALGLVVLHMTVPGGHGVDRSWAGHSHHMGPIMGFMLPATIEGTARALRLLPFDHPRLQRAKIVLPIALGLGLGGYGLSCYGSWAKDFNLRSTLVPVAPQWTNPAWRLIEQVPEGEVPIVSRITASVAANRDEAYTVDGSLPYKQEMRGLAAGTWMLVDTRQQGMLNRAQSMPGAEVIDQDGPYVLVQWNATGFDPTRGLWPKNKRIPKPQPFLGPYERRDMIPGIPPFESATLPEGTGGPIPVIPLPW